MSDNSNAIKEMERINKCCSGASPIYAHNNKRPHDNLECSQDKFNVMAKKIRLEGIPLSLGAVCLATSHCNMHEHTCFAALLNFFIIWVLLSHQNQIALLLYFFDFFILPVFTFIFTLSLYLSHSEFVHSIKSHG